MHVSTHTSSNNAENPSAHEIEFDRLKQALQSGTGSGRQSLDGFRAAGDTLVKLKSIIPHGKFGCEVTLRVGIEWRAEKAAENWRQHGVTFDQAAKAIGDPFAVEVIDDREDYSEERIKLLGMCEWVIPTRGR